MSVNLYQDYISFKEIDQLLKNDKGTAFKLFKQHRLSLIEGVDFIVLDAAQNAQIINDLRQQKRIYSSTVNLVMISLSGKAKLMAFAMNV